jgi:glycogen(starch) synthase
MTAEASQSDPSARPPGHPGVVPQRAVIVAATSVAFDSRTHRLATTLTDRGHDVTVIARTAAGLADDEVVREGYRVRRVPARALDGLPIPGTVRGALRRLDGMAGRSRGRSPALVRGLTRSLRVGLETRSQIRSAVTLAPPAEVLHAMAFLGLPVALAMSRGGDGGVVVYDARDIYADAANIARLPGPLRRAFERVERRWARRARRVVTVNEPYADVLATRLGPPRPLVVMNGPMPWLRPATAPRRFHEHLGLAETAQVVLYHGGFSPGRGIEQLIEALPLLAREVVLVLMGYGILADELRVRAADPVLAGRLRVLPAVPPNELIGWVASADVAAMPIQPTTLNHRLTTPNKLFEAMAAGVPVVASDLPGMAAIVRDAGCGVLCDPTDPAAIAAAIRSVLAASPDQQAAWRQHGIAAASGRYSWEAQVAGLLAEYGRLTGRPW